MTLYLLWQASKLCPMKRHHQNSQKSLRQRVADRKAGIKEGADSKRNHIIRRVKLAANLFQGIGLVMLLVALGQYIGSGYAEMNWVNVMIYSGMFLIGRAAMSFLNLSNILR